MRVGVVDIGTNSTRLLAADVDGGRVREVERRTRVTRLGEGQHVSPGGGQRPDIRGTKRRPCREDERKRHCELVEKLGVGPGEVEGDDRVVAGLGDDAA